MGAADEAVSLDVLLPQGGSSQAHWSAGEAAVGFDCAAAPFADEPLIQHISAVPCENSGVPSATVVSAALTMSKIEGEKRQSKVKNYTFKTCFCKSNSYPIDTQLSGLQQVLVKGSRPFSSWNR